MEKLSFTDLELKDVLESISMGTTSEIKELGQDSKGPYVGLCATSLDKASVVIERDLSDFKKVNPIVSYDARFFFDASRDIEDYIHTISENVCKEDWRSVQSSVEDFYGIHGDKNLDAISPLKIYSSILSELGEDNALKSALRYSECAGVFDKDSYSDGLYSIMRNKGGEPYDLAPKNKPKPERYTYIDKPANKYSVADISQYPIKFILNEAGARELPLGDLVDIVGEDEKPLSFNQDKNQWEVVIHDGATADNLEEYLINNLTEGEFARIGELDFEIVDPSTGGHGSYGPADAIDMATTPKTRKKRTEKIPSTPLDTVNWLDKLVSSKDIVTLYCVTSYNTYSDIENRNYVLRTAETSGIKIYTNKAAAIQGFQQKQQFKANVSQSVLLKLHVPSTQISAGTILHDTIVYCELMN